ncbi:hypothetical protein LPJ73_007870, partial [Coemansia sp. RSA 2703]
INSAVSIPASSRSSTSLHSANELESQPSTAAYYASGSTSHFDGHSRSMNARPYAASAASGPHVLSAPPGDDDDDTGTDPNAPDLAFAEPSAPMLVAPTAPELPPEWGAQHSVGGSGSSYAFPVPMYYGPSAPPAPSAPGVPVSSATSLPMGFTMPLPPPPEMMAQQQMMQHHQQYMQQQMLQFQMLQQQQHAQYYSQLQLQSQSQPQLVHSAEPVAPMASPAGQPPERPLPAMPPARQRPPLPNAQRPRPMSVPQEPVPMHGHDQPPVPPPKSLPPAVPTKDASAVPSQPLQSPPPAYDYSQNVAVTDAKPSSGPAAVVSPCPSDFVI